MIHQCKSHLYAENCFTNSCFEPVNQRVTVLLAPRIAWQRSFWRSDHAAKCQIFAFRQHQESFMDTLLASILWSFSASFMPPACRAVPGSTARFAGLGAPGCHVSGLLGPRRCDPSAILGPRLDLRVHTAVATRRLCGTRGLKL